MIREAVYIAWWLVTLPIELLGYGLEWVDDRLYAWAFGEEE